MSVGKKKYRHGLLFFVLFLFLLAGASSCSSAEQENSLALTNENSSASDLSQCEKPEISSIYGIYKLYSVKKISGGLTSEKKAKSNLNKKFEVEKNKFSVLGTEIRNPIYNIKCHQILHAEGNVQNKRWLVFYGIGSNRSFVKELQVFDGNESSETPYSYELALRNEQYELWENFDGYFYRFVKLNEN